MILDAVFERFIAASPLTVMARATIEHALGAAALDALFEQRARRGYTRQLLFSTTVDLMSLVVCGSCPHVKGAYHHLLERVPVSLKSVYEKLQHLETDVSDALVRAVADRCAALVAELDDVETERGWVRECSARVGSGDGLAVRLVVVRLKEPTQDGDDEIEILTNLPVEVAGAVRVSELYRSRWRIEGAFHELTMSLKCELNTLGYPRAALFGFCVALAAYNVLSVLKASLRAVHGAETVRTEVSGYYVAQEWSLVYAGLMVAVPADRWTRFGVMSATELAGCLRVWSGRVNLKKFKKSAPRPPTKHKPPRLKDRSTHLSTARLLAAAKEQKSRHRRGNTP
jgi:hypothetical protein